MSRIAGLDLGSVTLGIALSDRSAKIAFGKETMRYDGDLVGLAKKIVAYLNEQQVKTVVLGLPKNMDGGLGESAERSLSFKEALTSIDDSLEVILWDERLTTSMALKTIAMTKTTNKAKKRKERVDALAATNILQSYLDGIDRGKDG